MKRCNWLLAGIIFLSFVFTYSQLHKDVSGLSPQAAGDLDLTFNGTGKRRFGIGFGADQFNGVAIQPDGKIVAVGVAQGGSAQFEFSIARYNGDGTLDDTFGDGGYAMPIFGAGNNSFFHAVAIQPDGRIVAVGQTPGGVTSTDFAVVRFNADGTPDLTFDGDGIAITAFLPAGLQDFARAVVIQPDGKIIVAGSARVTQSPTTDDFALARYNPDGSLDTSFDGDGKVMTSFGGRFDEARSLAIQSDGKIVVAGFAGTTDIDFAVVRYNTDGSLDTTFDVDGRLTTSFGTSGDRAYSVVIQPDGKIVAAGSTTQPTTATDFAAARYNPDGSLDTSFDSDGRVTTVNSASGDEAKSVVLQPDGKLVFAGYLTSVAPDFAAVRYNPDGSLDTTFDGDGRVSTPVGTGRDEGFAASLQPDGKLVIAGIATSTDGDSALVRLNPDGSLDTSFDVDGKVVTPAGNFDLSLADSAIQADGKIVVAGTLLVTNNFDFAVARLNSDGTIDQTFGNNGSVRTTVGTGNDTGQAVAIQGDGKIVAAGIIRAGSFDNFGVVRYNPDGTLDTTFDGDGRVTTSLVAGNDQPWVTAIQPDGKILVAGRAANPFFHFAIVRYNANGSLDTTFDTDGIVMTPIGTIEANITDLCLLEDGRIVATGLAWTGSNHDFAVAMYNPDGSLDTSFGTNGVVTTPVLLGQDLGSASAVQPDGKIVVTGLSFDGTRQVFAVVRYNADGSLDTTFDGDGIVTIPVGTGSGQASGIALQPDEKILISGWAVFGSNADYVVARLNPNGSLDSAFRSGLSQEVFGTGGIATADLTAADLNPRLHLLNTGRIVLTGTSTGMFGVARLQNDLVPSAASASISGRVVDVEGRGIGNATLTLLNTRTNLILNAITGPFGYFQFEDLPVGDFYLLSVGHKRFYFKQDQQGIELVDDLTDVTFIGSSP